MIVKVTGYSPVKFIDDKTGEIIEGTNVYYLHQDMNVTGYVATKKFFRIDMHMPELVVDSDYNMEFGPKGRLLSFERVTGK